MEEENMGPVVGENKQPSLLIQKMTCSFFKFWLHLYMRII
jgi:hypothetical protein